MPLITRRAALSAFIALCASSSARAASARIAKWDSRKPTPALKLMNVDGAQWDLSALHGKVVVLNFWATWCEPCLAEMPQLNALARHRAEHDQLVVLGISYQEGEAAIRRFNERMPLGFPLLRDPDGAAFRAWGGGVLPSTVLVSRSGQARFTIQGELDWEGAQATEVLQLLLAEQTAHESK
jgi:cytochrome c biogenesis protein CcmG/thiol:disulfide interchange protein DsbE